MKQSSILQGVAQKGRVLQVVSTTKTDTFTASVAAGAPTDITGLTAAITPSATSSQIVVSATISVGEPENGVSSAVILKRGATLIGIGDTANNRARITSGSGGGNIGTADVITINFVDAPSSVSEITYGFKIMQSANSTQTVYVNRTSADTDITNRFRAVSTITLMEVAG
jgi:hypothetical protein